MDSQNQNQRPISVLPRSFQYSRQPAYAFARQPEPIQPVEQDNDLNQTLQAASESLRVPSQPLAAASAIAAQPAVGLGLSVDPKPLSYETRWANPKRRAKVSAKQRLILRNAGIVLAVILVGYGFFKLIDNPMTPTDVINSQLILKTVTSDSTDVDNNLNNAISANSSTEFNADLQSATSKLAAAGTALASFSHSRVNYTKQVKNDYLSYDSKWQQYSSYVNNEINDVKGLYIPYFQFTAQFADLNNIKTTSAAQGSSIIGHVEGSGFSAKTTISSQTEKNPADLILKKDLSTILGGVDANLNLANHDLNNNHAASFASDIQKVNTIMASASSSLQSDNINIIDQVNQAYPNSQYSNLGTSLGFLLNKVQQ